MITIDGKNYYCLKEVSDITGIPYATLYLNIVTKHRINYHKLFRKVVMDEEQIKNLVQ